MGSRTRGNLGGSGAAVSRQDWAVSKRNPRGLLENGAFVTKQALEVYLSGDYITCLECGKDCRSLGHHLSKTHAMSAVDYKKKYNIPKGRSLCGETTRRKSAKHMIERWENASEEDRENQRRHAKQKLGAKGLAAPRLAHFDKGYKKICPTCKNVFTADRKKLKYCSKRCHANSDNEQKRLKNMAKRAGKIRAATGLKDATGKFVAKGSS